MATFDFSDLKSDYENFAYPVMVLTVDGKDFSENDAGLVVSDIEVEITSGFEASAATFWIYNGYDSEQSRFRFNDLANYIYLGSCVQIALGYGSTVRRVFTGVISGVRFAFTEDEIAGVEVTAMDIKGLMMSGTYCRQLTAKNYGDAVREILQKTAYTKMKSGSIIEDLQITDTPDHLSETPADSSIEMVSESDYEFVVKAAKKYNYEFFTLAGTVYFRKAKEDASVLMEIGPGEGLRHFSVGYDLTGLVETVEVRNLDVGKSAAITAKKTISDKISEGNKAKPLLSGTQKVFVDPTVSSASEAQYRADYLAEDISYRFGYLEAETIGLPELVPGCFITVKDLGTAASNTFYLTRVRHVMDSDRGYLTFLEGKAASLT